MFFSSSLAVENPLYDSLPVPVQTCDSGVRATSPTASLISDSVAYCGRFPAADRRQCPQCGEPLATGCPHRDLEEVEVASVSSAGLSSSGGGPPSTTASDQQAALSFHTFHPRRGPSNHERSAAHFERGSLESDGPLLTWERKLINFDTLIFFKDLNNTVFELKLHRCLCEI